MTVEHIAALCPFPRPRYFLTSVFALLFVTFCQDRGLTRGLSHPGPGVSTSGDLGGLLWHVPVTVLRSLSGRPPPRGYASHHLEDRAY